MRKPSTNQIRIALVATLSTVAAVAVGSQAVGMTAARPAPPSTISAATVTAVPPTTEAPMPTVTSAPRGNPLTLRGGDRGPRVKAIQDRLVALGYWLGTPDGSYGYLTEQAVTAFQKVRDMTRDGIAGPAVLAALDDATPPPVMRGGGDLVEVDTVRQVLYVVRDGFPRWTLNVSTGTGERYQVNGRTEIADTPPGRWTVSREHDGPKSGELGTLYRPRYFHSDGIAVHGHRSVPAYAASHGCVRVTNAAMDWIWSTDAMPIGSVVWVY